MSATTSQVFVVVCVIGPAEIFQPQFGLAAIEMSSFSRSPDFLPAVVTKTGLSEMVKYSSPLQVVRIVSPFSKKFALAMA